jgi:enoyl-CoA hydratase/carnithine racemase
MYRGLTRLLNETAVDDRVVITALTGTGDFYSSGNDLSNALNSFSFDDLVKSIKDSCNIIRYG